MKTLCSVGWCASVALLLGLSAVDAWADEGPKGPTAAKGDAKSTPAMCRCGGGSSSAVMRINQLLAEPLKSNGLEFTDEPLESVVNFLHDEYGIPIQIDVPALEDAGLKPDEQISVNLHNISLHSALRLLLKTKQLTYVIQNEVLIITTPEEAESELTTCVYDVRDLIDMDRDNREIKALADVIVSCVAPETWAVHKGGEAEIRTLRPGLLVISQTQAVHEQIGGLLALIRETLRQPVHRPEDEAMGMIRGGRGGEGYGGRGMEAGGYGVGRGGEMGAEPTPAEATPFD